MSDSTFNCSLSSAFDVSSAAICVSDALSSVSGITNAVAMNKIIGKIIGAILKIFFFLFVNFHAIGSKEIPNNKEKIAVGTDSSKNPKAAIINRIPKRYLIKLPIFFSAFIYERLLEFIWF